jgi:LPS sulfotransferase NodH
MAGAVAGSLVEADRLSATYRRFRRHAGALGRVGNQVLTGQRLTPIRFVVFGRGRSGSTTLMSLLGGISHVHCDGEILNSPVPFPRTYVHACCARSGAPVYGCKILSYQVAKVQPLRRRTEFVRQLSADGFAIVYLKRENLVEHAVSNIRAREFGFHRSAASDGQHGKLVIDPQKVLHWIAVSESFDRFEAASLTAVPHLALTYEQNLADDELHGPTVRQIAEFLRVPTDDLRPPKSAYRKVSPRTLRESVANYPDLVAALAGTPYARYVD